MMFNEEGLASVCLVDSLDSALDVIKEYELQTSSSFSIRSSKLRSFGHTDYDPLKRHRIYWEEKGGSGLPFSQVPFIVLNCMFLDCSRGPDRHKKLKKKREKDVVNIQNKDKPDVNPKTRLRISKKEDCPALIQMKEVVFFPEYTISENTRSRKERMSKIVRDELKSGKKVLQERKIILHLPPPSKHTRHPLCHKPRNTRRLNVGLKNKISGLVNNATRRKPRNTCGIDFKLKTKISELVNNFVTDPTEIRKRISKYVKEVLFPNSTLPDEQNKKFFYPTDEDIRILVIQSLKKLGMPTSGQINDMHMFSEHAYANTGSTFIVEQIDDSQSCLSEENEIEVAVHEILPDVEEDSEQITEEIVLEVTPLYLNEQELIIAETESKMLTNQGVADILNAAETLKKKITLEDTYLERTSQVKRSIDDAMSSYVLFYENAKKKKPVESKDSSELSSVQISETSSPS